MTLFCDFLKVRDHLERPLKSPQCTQRVFGKIKHNRIGSKEYFSAISVIPTVGGGQISPKKFKKSFSSLLVLRSPQDVGWKRTALGMFLRH